MSQEKQELKVEHTMHPQDAAETLRRANLLESFKKRAEAARAAGNVCCWKCGMPTGVTRIPFRTLKVGKVKGYCCESCLVQIGQMGAPEGGGK